MGDHDEGLALPGQLHKAGDYTYYRDRDRDPPESYEFRSYHALLESRTFAPHGFSASCSGRVFRHDRDPKTTYVEGRMLICRCYRGREIAVTLRELDKGGDLKAAARRPDEERQELESRLYHPSPPVLDDGDWNARWDAFSRYFKSEDPARIGFPVTIGEVRRVIDDLAFGGSEAVSEATGLVLVTGSTNSAKSELTRGLIDQVLRRQIRKFREGSRKRRPHLLTFEDPIERWLFEDGKTTSRALAEGMGVEYTPREKGVDVGTLKDAVDDALRQTPSIFYVGEVREDADWAELLRFAGTGHLVVATAHAGSLIEAMERIFRGVGAETPAARGQIAQRINAVIHQRMFNLQEMLRDRPEILPAKFEVLLPSVWRRTPAGVAALVSDGLSSVLPNIPDEAEEDRTSSFGRRWFVQKFSTDHWGRLLGKAYRERGKEVPGAELAGHVEVVKNHFKVEAIRYDLMGI